MDRQKKKEYLVMSTDDRQKGKERTIKDLVERCRYTKYDSVSLSAAEAINSVTWDGTFQLYK